MRQTANSAIDHLHPLIQAKDLEHDYLKFKTLFLALLPAAGFTFHTWPIKVAPQGIVLLFGYNKKCYLEIHAIITLSC